MAVDPFEPGGAPFEPVDHRRPRKPLTPLQKKAAIFGPILVVVGTMVTILGVPWQIVAGFVATFVLWLLIEG